MKNTIIAIIVVLVVVVGGYFAYKSLVGDSEVAQENVEEMGETTEPEQTQEVPQQEKQTILGTSVEKRDIVAYHYGTGSDEIVFVGGIHGGYAWNTTLLAHELIDYLEANPSAVPANEKVTVIPSLNPDGLYKIVGKAGRFTKEDVPASKDTVAGRFNSNSVDINRNFDCEWKSEAVWQNKKVSGGSAVFSEPESQAMKKYIEEKRPKAVVVWYSAAGGVYESRCGATSSAEIKTLTSTYAKASGYPAHKDFEAYATTGDMTNWLAKIGIPATSVLLTNHTDTEWTKNKAGIEAVLKQYSR